MIETLGAVLVAVAAAMLIVARPRRGEKVAFLSGDTAEQAYCMTFVALFCVGMLLMLAI